MTVEAQAGTGEGAVKRWVWDLHPLAKDSWGAWKLEPEMPRPDHRIYMYRYQGDDGSVGPVMELKRLHDLMERIGSQNCQKAAGKILHREAYEPTDEDFTLLKLCYPKADPARPEWYRVKTDLAVAGHAPDTLTKAEAPLLLGLLRKAKGAPAPGGGEVFGSSEGGDGCAGQGKARSSRENAFGKTSRAGAQSAISTNEDRAETSDKVRTEDPDAYVARLNEKWRKEDETAGIVPPPEIGRAHV